MSIFVSLLTAGTNSHEETSENANAIATDFVSEGVIGAITNTSGVAPSTGAFAVNAQGTPDMTVAVSSGVAYVTGTPTSQNSQTVRVRMTADQNVTISANSSGSTKYDWIYIQLDATKLANPAVNADDVATLVTSRSSSSSSDDGTPPTYGYPVSVVTVANGTSGITNANITDKRALAGSVQDGAVTTNSLAATSVTADKVDFGNAGSGIWWEEIGRTTLASAADIITVSSFAACTYLMIIVRTLNSGGAANPGVRFNNDSGANYTLRFSKNGAADTSNVSKNQLDGAAGTTGQWSVRYLDVINIANAEKMVYIRDVNGAATGAATPPDRLELAGKWANTTSSITRVDVINAGAGDFGNGSEVVVLGHN